MRYGQHGWRHDPNGSDPIPLQGLSNLIAAAGASGLPCCLATRTTTFTLPADAAFHAPDWDNMQTNNASVFTWPYAGGATLASGITTSGAVGMTAGVYMVAWSVTPTAAPPSSEYVQTGAWSGGGNLVGGYVKGDTTSAAYYMPALQQGWYGFQIVESGDFFGVPDSAANDPLALLLNKQSGSALDFSDIHMFVCRLNGPAASGVGTGAGIFFDVANAGDWLQITTTGFGASATTGYSSYTDMGVAIVDSGTGGIVIGTDNGGDVFVDSDHDLNIDAVRNVNVNGVNFVDTATESIQIYTGSSPEGYFVNGGQALFTLDGGFEADAAQGIKLNESGPTLASNDIVISSDNNRVQVKTNGTLVFEIRNDGTIHALTGGSIHFDL